MKNKKELYNAFINKHFCYYSTIMTDTHMMVDLETLGLDEDAVITSIGALMFDPRGMDTEDSLTNIFYIRVDPISAQRMGCTIDASTVLWWLQQSDKARNEMLGEDQIPFGLAISSFAQWMYKAKPTATRVWAQGYDFDISKLRNAFSKCNEIWPFHFADSRCVRTINELSDPEQQLSPIGIGVAHNALDDAKRQALIVQRSYRILNS